MTTLKTLTRIIFQVDLYQPSNAIVVFFYTNVSFNVSLFFIFSSAKEGICRRPVCSLDGLNHCRQDYVCPGQEKCCPGACRGCIETKTGMSRVI